jgi:hypothetical protein
MGTSDVFPLQPVYPIQRDPYDRKVRVPMPDGDIKIRSRGADPQTFALTGFGTIADQTTLQTFYEAQAADVFTFQDKSFSSERDVVVRFVAAPEWEEWFEYMIWKCTLREELS